MNEVNWREGTMTKNTILLIGNDKPTQDMFTNLLAADYDCVCLPSSAEGLSYMDAGNILIELIIMDLNESALNQFQLLKGVRGHSIYANIPILAIATSDQSEEITQALSLGVDDIIRKPIQMHIASKRVLNLLSLGKGRMIHNVMEDLIETEINDNLTTLGICPCPKCRRDLLTLTLNNVTPKYISTEKGEAVIRATRLASMNDRIQLLAEITRLAALISENPRHD